MPKPKRTINWDQVKELCRIHCTQEEVVAVLNSDSSQPPLSHRSFERAIKREQKMTFYEFFKIHSLQGSMSLRRAQWAAALGAKRKQTIMTKKTTKMPDGTIVTEEVPKDIDFYPKPSERMMLWLGQNVLQQTARINSEPQEEAMRLPIGSVKIEVLGNASGVNTEYSYDQPAETRDPILIDSVSGDGAE